MAKSTNQPVVIIPNLNGGKELLDAVESLQAQTLKPYIIVVDNASTDDSVKNLQRKYPDVELIQHDINKGYAGGVNPGLQRAIELRAEYAAPFNDDAIADPKWLERLVHTLNEHDSVGAAAPKVLEGDGLKLDSTGDIYTSWGLPYPRGRGDVDTNQYDTNTKYIFAASGAASLFRVEALKQVGLFDEDFFAYYEDVDLGFRLQRAGWKALYVPESRVYHQIGMTSGRIKGFTTYQTMKNLPMLALKNVPHKYYWRVRRRLTLALFFFFLRAITRGHGWAALTGYLKYRQLYFKKRGERRQIEANKKVGDDYIWSIITPDLPPNASALRKLRKLTTGKSA